MRRLEGQRKIISDREIVLICGALGCTASWLLSEPSAPEPGLLEIESAIPDQNEKD